MFLEIKVTDTYEDEDKEILINTNQIQFVEKHPYIENYSRITFCGELDYLNVKANYYDLMAVLEGEYFWLKVEDRNK